LSRLVIHVAYFTDPLCPWSWVAEPRLRDLLEEFSGQVEITYVMAGMAEDIHADQKLESTREASQATGVPADERVWVEDPPTTSYPACRAVKAAALQGFEEPMLRRLREGTFLRRERLDHADALVAAARDIEGLDAERFATDLESEEVARLFATDRETALAACGDDRPSLPAFSVDGGEPIGIADLRAAIVKCLAPNSR
jgi:predicted DsbA family dithiol-disulfide isomerase